MALPAPSADLVLKDAQGRRVHPLAKSGKVATVYIFALSECPIANAYAPEIKRIAEKYTRKRTALSLVLVDPGMTPAKASQYAKAYGYGIPVLVDPDQSLARRFKIGISPEVAVFDKNMALVYRGRIDDQYFGLGRRRSTVRSRDLRNALDAILSGKAVRPSSTEAIGCTLPQAR
jgi:hypothetical protein